MTGHPSNLTWSLALGDDLDLGQKLALRWHLRRCARCRETHAALQAQKRAYEAEADAMPTPWATTKSQSVKQPQDGIFHDGSPFGTEPRAPHRARGTPWAVHGAWSFGLAAACVLLVLVPRAQHDAAPRGPWQAKGASQLQIFVRRADVAAPLGERCVAGDRLRARLQSDRRYALVVEVDGRGAVQVVHPPGGARSAPLGGTDVLTEQSWELDASGGRERFVALFSDVALEVSDAIAALKRGAALADVEQREVACSKP